MCFFIGVIGVAILFFNLRVVIVVAYVVLVVFFMRIDVFHVNIFDVFHVKIFDVLILILLLFVSMVL